MNGKNAIIEKIINDSKDLAKSFIEEAQKKADYEINKGRTYALDYQKKYYQKIDKEKQAIIYRKVSHAQIEAKKMILAKKRQIIEDIFNAAMQKFINNKTQYAQYLAKLIEKFAEDGDTVTVSRDGGIIDRAAVEKIAGKNKIALQFQKSKQNFDGVILKSANYDKNLTVNLLFEQIKAKHITEITNILFGGGASYD